VFTRLKSTDVRNALVHDPVELAHRRYREILEQNPLHTIADDRAREIDRVEREAAKALASISGALE
jgi:hypothetical protein